MKSFETVNREDQNHLFMHLSMLSPRGGTPGICGAFDLYCLPHPREFDLESRPQGGDMCSPVRRSSWN